MARKKMGMKTLALAGGAMAAAWYFLRSRSIGETMHPGLPLELDPTNAAIYSAQKEMERYAAEDAARRAATTGAGFSPIREMSLNELLAKAPAASGSINPAQWTMLQNRYPDAWLLSLEQVAAIKQAGIVPERYTIVAASPSLKQIDAGALMIVVPEQMVPMAANTLSGYGALYAVHGSSGVTGLGY